MRALTKVLILAIIPVSTISAAPASELPAAPSANPRIRILRQPLGPGAINPMQYGQFVEYLCDLVPAMWAEKLYDGSFEGLSPYKFAFISQTDFKEKPWHPSGAVNRGNYTLDKQSKINGLVAQKIEAKGTQPCTLGLSQDGVFVERGKPCTFKFWLRAEKLLGPVRVKLHRESELCAALEFWPGAEWKQFQGVLTSSAHDGDATLTIEFRGPGTIWVDLASLIPRDTVAGWRPDVVQAVHALKPGIIRFGGSAVDEPGFGDFEWKDTIGPLERRKPFRAWGGLQPVGPGLEEFVQFCRAVNAEPLICVRFSNRTPRDAAEEVEYFNGGANTPMGALRIRNGHAEPYRVKFWQIGNERQSSEYDAQVGAFCITMREADPAIRILSSFPTATSLRNAGVYFDYVCPHHYTPDLAACERSLDSIQHLLQENTPARNIKVAVTEWNTTAGDWGLGRAQLMTLANALACSRYHNLLHRHCDLVEIANRSNLINSFGSGIIQTDNHRLYKTPTYYAQMLYATLAGEQPLRIERLPATNTFLDLSATFRPAAASRPATVTLFAVNDTLEHLMPSLDFSDFGGRPQRLTVWTLSDRHRALEPDVRNTFGEPERISARQSTFGVRGPRFGFPFPALSLTVLQWRADSADSDKAGLPAWISPKED